MTPSQRFVQQLPNDIGGAPADRIDIRDHELQPWEKRCHALADVLDYHKLISTEESGAEWNRWAATSSGSCLTTSGGLWPLQPSSFKSRY